MQKDRNCMTRVIVKTPCCRLVLFLLWCWKQCYQSCVSNPTKTDGLNKSNTMQGHASCLSECTVRSAEAELKCVSRRACSSSLCGPAFLEIRLWSLFIFLNFTKIIKLSGGHYGYSYSMGTASRGNANISTADNGVFNIHHIIDESDGGKLLILLMKEAETCSKTMLALEVYTVFSRS